jgi:hypothetical protein
MPCDIFQYKGSFYTKDNLYRVLGDPSSHEEVFWQLNKDNLDKVKSLKENIQGFYKDIFDGNEKQIMYEAAVQANSSESEKSGAISVFGPEIIALSQETFPNAKVGSTYQQEISREITRRFPSPEHDETVNFQLRIVNALANPKVEQLFNRFYKNNPDKFYFELNIYAGKQQVDLLRDWNNVNNPNSLEEMAAGILANMSQVVTVKTAMDNDFNRSEDDESRYYWFDLNGDHYRRDAPFGTNVDDFSQSTFFRNNDAITKEDFLEARRIKDKSRSLSSYYSNLTVPGGTNYTENEIATPGITPAIKGHAAFATDKGIGWFRSDDKHPFTGFLEDLIASGTIKKVPCG